MIWRSWSWGILELLAEILGVLDLESRGRGVQRLSRSSKILPARDFSENQPAQVHKWRSWGNGNLWGTLLGVGGEASGVHQQPHGDGCLVREGALGLEVEVGANIHITGHAREPSIDFNASSWSWGSAWCLHRIFYIFSGVGFYVFIHIESSPVVEIFILRSKVRDHKKNDSAALDRLL